MNKLHHIRSTSKQSAIAEPIILRKGEKSRLVFKPEIVDNKKNPSACVKGTFIFQVKGIKEEWSDYKTLDLTRLRKGEWVKLQLKSGELLTLITALDDFYNIYEKYGIVRGEKDVIITDANIKTVVVEMLSSDVNLKRVFAEGGPELIIKTIEWLGNSDDSKEIIEKLKKLEISTIARVNSILGLSQLKKVLEIWNGNQTNPDEEFWQQLFTANAWTISQVFSFPMVILEDKAYLGGKEISNRGGNIVDFIFKNKLTKNTILVEIKTPMTPIIASEYRGTYCLHSEFTGPVNQLLNYKDELQKTFYTLTRGEEANYSVFNPRCLLVVGSISNEDIKGQKLKAFDLFRNDQRNVDIITYDELFEKVDGLIKILEDEY